MAFNYHLGYDPDKDYSLAILAAKTETERAALRRERENKIMDRYGGIDPYKGEHADIIRGYGDPSADYLNALYAQKTAAELAGLQAAYEKNAAAEKASLDAIAPKYYAARNTAWSESEKDKRDFARFGAAYGLNTGASGQAELSRSVTTRGILADLTAAEMAETAAGESKLRELEEEYRLSVAAARAAGQQELAQAQYEEYVRKQEAEQKKAEFEAEMAYKNADSARETAMALLKAGAMPSAETLAAAGISTADARSYLGAVRAAAAAKGSRKSSSSAKKSNKEEETEDETTDEIRTYDGLSPAAKSLYTSCQLQMRRSGYPYMTNQMRTNIFDAYVGGTISRKEYTFIMTELGG